MELQGKKVAFLGDSITEACYMPDGLHPNDAGHMLIANRLLSTLNTL